MSGKVNKRYIIGDVLVTEFVNLFENEDGSSRKSYMLDVAKIIKKGEEVSYSHSFTLRQTRDLIKALTEALETHCLQVRVKDVAAIEAAGNDEPASSDESTEPATS